MNRALGLLSLIGVAVALHGCATVHDRCFEAPAAPPGQGWTMQHRTAQMPAIGEVTDIETVRDPDGFVQEVLIAGTDAVVRVAPDLSIMSSTELVRPACCGRVWGLSQFCDLDGDGRPELLSSGEMGGVKDICAFSLDGALLWHVGLTDLGWREKIAAVVPLKPAGPDDAGSILVIARFGGAACLLDARGALKRRLEMPQKLTTPWPHAYPADIDSDGIMEAVYTSNTTVLARSSEGDVILKEPAPAPCSFIGGLVPAAPTGRGEPRFSVACAVKQLGDFRFEGHIARFAGGRVSFKPITEPLGAVPSALVRGRDGRPVACLGLVESDAQAAGAGLTGRALRVVAWEPETAGSENITCVGEQIWSTHLDGVGAARSGGVVGTYSVRTARLRHQPAAESVLVGWGRQLHFFTFHEPEGMRWSGTP